MFANTLQLGDKSAAKEPQRAIAEAIRLRLDELFQSGCGVRLTGKQLNEQVSLISADPAKRDHFGVLLSAGYPVATFYTEKGAGIALYEWRDGQMRTRIIVTHDGADMQQQLLLLDLEVFKPEGAKQPLLAVINTHPWMASCWRALRMRVLEPSGDPVAPKALLDRETSGRWCEEVKVRIQGSNVNFSYLDWYGVFLPMMDRTRVEAYEYEAGSLVRRFGFPKEIPELVDDWLSLDWNLAKQAVVQSQSAALQPEHRRLSQAVKKALARKSAQAVRFTLEVFPGATSQRRVAVYCALSSDDTKPCPDFPKPVDITLEWDGTHWLVRSVKAR